MIREVYQCPRCKSLDVSMDISTGKINCNRCETENKPDRFNFHEFLNNLKEKENENNNTQNTN